MDPYDIFNIKPGRDNEENKYLSTQKSDKQSGEPKTTIPQKLDDFMDNCVSIEVRFQNDVKCEGSGLLIYKENKWFVISAAHLFVESDTYVFNESAIYPKNSFVYIKRNGEDFLIKVKLESVHINPNYFETLFGMQGWFDIAVGRLQELEENSNNSDALKSLKELQSAASIDDSVPNDHFEMILKIYTLELCGYPCNLPHRQIRIKLGSPQYDEDLSHCKFKGFKSAKQLSGSPIFYTDENEVIKLVGIL